MAENPMKNLIEYLKRNLKKGYTINALKFALVNQGYSKVAVEEALKRVTKELAEEAPILKEKPVIKYEIVDEYDKPIRVRKSFLKRFFEM